MNTEQNLKYVNTVWDESIIPALVEYIKIPNKSPQFDPEWEKHGYMDQAIDLITDWCKQHAAKDMRLEVVRSEGRTPLIFIEIPGQTDETILLYGHLDKQPEMTGWNEDLGPWKPVLKGDRLYGRGSADDGYAAFASLTAINTLQSQGNPHARCVIMIEASEESGSPDLPYYIEALKDKIGTPALVICLDSGCGNYEQLWMTTSLRGLVGGTLNISTMREGIHSGSGSGIVPSCFRVLEQLISRVEDEATGDVILDELKVTIPDGRLKQAEIAANVLQTTLFEELPMLPGVEPESDSITDLILRRTWKSALSVIGIDGMPSIKNAGNVSLPTLSLKLSMRLPPTVVPETAAEALKKTFEANPPNGAKVVFEINDTGPGWNAPAESAWLIDAINTASKTYFGKESVAMGEGGSIPFMGMLGKRFPAAQFLITGVLGPHSNAHGPNEFLHIPTGKKLTACIAYVIAEQCKKK
jgi:acetylornithine deacetylase/succinyl-diaminopimelate desuccinylase-like protein